MLKKILPYFYTPLLAGLLFILVFQLWKVDLSGPFFGYDHDMLMSVFEVKNILHNGWLISNNEVGFPYIENGFFLYDFPIYIEFFSTLIVKFLRNFFINPFAAANCFFILTIMLVAFTSFTVLRHFKVSTLTSFVISILYAFLPYHFSRGIWHLFLSNYLIAPIIVMLALWIIEDKITVFNLKDKSDGVKCFTFSPNSTFFITLFLSLFIAICGLYYAFYACLIFIISWFLRGLKKDSFFDKDAFAAIIFSALIFLILILFHLPSLFYWIKHGDSSAFGRFPEESEYFSLRIVDMLLPVKDHFIKYFSDLHDVAAMSFWDNNWHERRSSSLGIIASIGFLSLILWIFLLGHNEKTAIIQRTIKRFRLEKDDKNLISNLANLNFISLIFVTAGGLIMFIALIFPFIRAHARFVVFISFISLFFMAIIFDKIIESKFFKKKIYAQILILAIGVLGLLDQVGKASAEAIQPKEVMTYFNSDRDFFSKVEKSMPANSKIFMLPVHGFPEGDDYSSLAAYLHSNNLKWSYPVIRGRKNHLWQKEAEKLSAKDFVKKIKGYGFSGVVVNFGVYYDLYDEEKRKEMYDFENYLRKISKQKIIVSKDSRFGFFEI